MIRYSVIVSVLPIYLYSINAQSIFEYIPDSTRAERELFHEGRFIAENLRLKNESADSHHDSVCDSLDERKKRLLCDTIMIRMINGKNEGVFESFVQTACSRPIPQLARSLENPYKCEKQYIETSHFEKRMYWCKSKKYKTQSGDTDEMDGFFCAGVIRYPWRAYAFRPPKPVSDSVEPVGIIIVSDSFEKAFRE